MTPSRQRLSSLLDRLIAGLLVALVLGSALAFGGATWWGPPAIVGAATLLGLASLARSALSGRWTILKSPLTAIGLLALALAAVQLVPLPGGLARRISPRAHAAHATGQAPSASGPIEAESSSRTPATLDRPATLRWLIGAAVGLTLFGVSAHFADRLSRSMLLWGSVAAAFSACSVLGVAQIFADSGGLYGAIEPGSGPFGSPSLSDLASTPGSTAVLRLSADPRRPRQAWPVTRPDRQFQVGSLTGGPGAFLALASLGLPMALGLALQAIAPRGSREGLKARLRESNRGGLAVLLAGSAVVGAGLAGYLGGPILAIPFALGLVVAGLPSAIGTGLRWAAPGLTSLAIAGLVAGVALRDPAARPPGSPAISGPEGLKAARVGWVEGSKIARDFPILGAGFGSFGAVVPYYKWVDRSESTPGSGLIQWWAESGWAGLAILGAAAIWALIKLPGAIRKVGSADRALALGAVGSIASFGALWVVQGPAGPWSVWLAACAIGGPCNRWLAGGTDLFVEAD